jgi:hypothetical protein
VKRRVGRHPLSKRMDATRDVFIIELRNDTPPHTLQLTLKMSRFIEQPGGVIDN